MEGWLNVRLRQAMLINEYHFPVDKASIYYLFDRDPLSNTDAKAIQQYIDTLKVIWFHHFKENLIISNLELVQN